MIMTSEIRSVDSYFKKINKKSLATNSLSTNSLVEKSSASDEFVTSDEDNGAQEDSLNNSQLSKGSAFFNILKNKINRNAKVKLRDKKNKRENNGIHKALDNDTYSNENDVIKDKVDNSKENINSLPVITASIFNFVAKNTKDNNDTLNSKTTTLKGANKKRLKLPKPEVNNVKLSEKNKTAKKKSKRDLHKSITKPTNKPLDEQSMKDPENSSENLVHTSDEDTPSVVLSPVQSRSVCSVNSLFKNTPLGRKKKALRCSLVESLSRRRSRGDKSPSDVMRRFAHDATSDKASQGGEPARGRAIDDNGGASIDADSDATCDEMMGEQSSLSREDDAGEVLTDHSEVKGANGTYEIGDNADTEIEIDDDDDAVGERNCEDADGEASASLDADGSADVDDDDSPTELSADQASDKPRVSSRKSRRRGASHGKIDRDSSDSSDQDSSMVALRRHHHRNDDKGGVLRHSKGDGPSTETVCDVQIAGEEEEEQTATTGKRKHCDSKPFSNKRRASVSKPSEENVPESKKVKKNSKRGNGTPPRSRTSRNESPDQSDEDSTVKPKSSFDIFTRIAEGKFNGNAIDAKSGKTENCKDTKKLRKPREKSKQEAPRNKCEKNKKKDDTRSRMKQKKSKIVEIGCGNNDSDNVMASDCGNNGEATEDVSPRRSSRKSVKLQDSIYLVQDSSEDSDANIEIQSKNSIKSKTKAQNKSINKSVKASKDSNVPLASIFTKSSCRSSSPSTTTTTTKTPAAPLCPLKKAFLNSGVPDELKTKIIKEKQTRAEQTCRVTTPTCHVTQSSLDHRMFSLKSVEPSDLKINLKSCAANSTPTSVQPSYDVDFKIERKSKPKLPVRRFESRKMKDMSSKFIVSQLDEIRDYCPCFSAKTMYKSLLTRYKNFKNGEAWTEKYQPNSDISIIGNSVAKSNFLDWLTEWQLSMKKDNQSQNRKTKSRGHNYYSDSDYSEDNEDLSKLCNLAVITGPGGTGKTAAVYAIAKQLGFKVFEVNSTSSRKAQHILSRLKEATQSHHIAHKDVKFFKKNESNKKEEESEETEKKQQNSLILFDEIDVHFQSEKSFLSAVNTFVSTTKRPIILTSRHLTSDLPTRYRHFPLEQTSTAEIVAYLKIICLVEKIKPIVNFKDLEFLVKLYSHDIRRCINAVQFTVESGSLKKTFNFSISMHIPNLVALEKTTVVDVLKGLDGAMDLDLLHVTSLNDDVATADKAGSGETLVSMAKMADGLAVADAIRGRRKPADNRWFRSKVACSEDYPQCDDSFRCDLDICSEIDRLALRSGNQSTLTSTCESSPDDDLIERVLPVFNRNEKMQSEHSKRLQLLDDLSMCSNTTDPSPPARLPFSHHRLSSFSADVESRGLRRLRLHYASALALISSSERLKLVSATRKRHFLHYLNHAFDLDQLADLENGLALDMDEGRLRREEEDRLTSEQELDKQRAEEEEKPNSESDD